MNNGWNAATYLQYADERTRPAIELATRAPLDEVRLGVDLGCGPGNSTAVLAARWPKARLIGVDDAPDMLEKARASGVAAQWVAADIRDWTPDETPDLIFSNALFQWVDGHERLFPRLMSMLRSGGALAIQMPRNFAAPSHELLRETAREPRFRATLEPLLREDPVAGMEAYADLLEPHAARLDIWETTYLQRLTGDDPVLKWVSGTALVPLMAALDEAGRAAFRAAYGEKLRHAYPRRADGGTLFPFTRIFMVAIR